MSRVSVDGAAEVLRPPEDGLPYLRHDRAGHLRLDGGSLTVRDGRIAAFEDDAGYDQARQVAGERGLDLPGVTT